MFDLEVAKKRHIQRHSDKCRCGMCCMKRRQTAAPALLSDEKCKEAVWKSVREVVAGIAEAHEYARERGLCTCPGSSQNGGIWENCPSVTGVNERAWEEARSFQALSLGRRLILRQYSRMWWWFFTLDLRYMHYWFSSLYLEGAICAHCGRQQVELACYYMNCDARLDISTLRCEEGHSSPWNEKRPRKCQRHLPGLITDLHDKFCPEAFSYHLGAIMQRSFSDVEKRLLKLGLVRT